MPKKINKTPNTLKSTNVFLTIPHFDELESVYQLLESKSEELFISRFAVVLETHTKDENKGKHLHAFVKFTKQREISLKFFDFLGKHGKLEKVRSLEAVLRYMNKENVCKANFDVTYVLLKSKETFANTVRELVLAGWTEQAILRDYGDLLSRKYWSKAITFAKACLAAEMAGKAIPTKRMRSITREIIEKRLSPEELAVFDQDPQFAIFVDYVNKMLRYGNQQLHKQCCLTLVGAPSIGKTYVVNALKQFFYTYVYPIDGWHTDYENGVYEMVLWHEWDIKLISKSDLLLFTEGEIVDLKVKHSKAVKRDRPMIIFSSNDTYTAQARRRFGYDPEWCESIIKALDVRLKELNFGQTTIWFLTKLFVATVEDI